MTKRQQLKEIFLKHKDRVIVHCDEYHAHSARSGCLGGSRDSVDICLLWEEIQRLEGKLDRIKKIAKRGKS